MNILVIRHAPAKDSSPSGKDSDRPLSPSGREFFEEVCQDLQFLFKGFVYVRNAYMKKPHNSNQADSSLIFPPSSMDILLSSPLLRAQETANIFCRFFKIKSRKTTHHLKPLARPKDLLQEINSLSLKSVVIVGHQPFLSAFVGLCAKEKSAENFRPDRGSVSFLKFPSKEAKAEAKAKTASLLLLLPETDDYLSKLLLEK